MKGSYEVEWFDTEEELLAAYPYPSLDCEECGCRLREPDRQHKFLWCEKTESCDRCYLHGIGVFGGIYWYCTCDH